MASTISFPDDLLRRLQGFQRAASDPSEILERLQSIAVEDNRRGLLAGQDKDGRPLAPLARSTMERRKGGGPPLAPTPGTRFITAYEVEARVTGNGQITIEGTWPGFDDVAGYAISGTRNMPARDVGGVRPWGKARMSSALKEALKEWLRSKWSG